MAYIHQEFERLAGKALHQYRMVSDGDRVLVGLSGGKDSLALLLFLDERRRRFRTFMNRGRPSGPRYEEPASASPWPPFLDDGASSNNSSGPTCARWPNPRPTGNPCFL
jgi:hypothetical protein